MSWFLKWLIRWLLGTMLLIVRIVQIETRILRTRFSISKPHKIQLFNVDLHTSVIADMKVGLKDFDVNLVSWSLTNDNINFRKFFKVKDPAAGLTGKSWLNLDASDFDVFRNRYRRYLSTFDGFIVCFPPAFLELFLSQGKPILVVIATRYESPFTDRESEWAKFNTRLKEGFHNGQLVIAVNNRGDKDYLKYFTSLTGNYVPSLCDYTGQRWNRGSEKRLLLSRGSVRLREIIEKESGYLWKSPREEFGTRFSWSQLHQAKEILFLPYQISTMTLFELATSGVPVSVPSRELLKTLRAVDKEILSELSFYQVRNKSTVNLSFDDPNKTEENNVLDWWLDRADFYDDELMPNVRVISTLSELHDPHPYNSEADMATLRINLQNRNSKLYLQRHSLLKDFLERVAASRNTK